MTIEQIEAEIAAVTQRMLQRSNEQTSDHARLQTLFADRNRLLIKPAPAVEPVATEDATNG